MEILILLIFVCVAVAVFYTVLGIFVLLRLGFNLTFRLDKAWRSTVKKSKEYKDFEKELNDLL